VSLFLAVILAAVLRSIRLMDLFPVLVDEAIYMRWAEIIQHQHTWFVSLLDAKPPLGYWIYAGMRLLFAGDPLLGDRLVSVAAGTLCVVFLYRIGFICSGPRAGVVTALLYSVLPYGVFYDRIAYIDSLVNLFGVLLVYSSLRTFGAAELSWTRTVVAGLTLGIGLFIKTTILLLALAPLVIGLSLWRGRLQRLAAHVAALYAVAALFPLFSQLAIPAGPRFDINNVLLHHTDFFTPLGVLLRDPLVDLKNNGPLLAGYAAAYLTWPALVATAVGMAALVVARDRIPVAILLACVVPFSFAVITLEYFPSRYSFPHAWPSLLVIACAGAIPRAHGMWRWVVYGATTVVFAGMAIQSARILHLPESALHERDTEEFLSPNPYSGSGVLEAIRLLRSKAQNEPITILTDPWWGPPTDAVFAYLNEFRGTKVYEAWWLQLEGEYGLVPAGGMPVWKSQYQRIACGEVDFSLTANLYYITDTNYFTPVDVRALSPDARLLQRFPKRGGQDFIDVYKLR
jgi:4-amino-4-deoxy-L-arabinose transferase-like glycosyltransferase